MGSARNHARENDGELEEALAEDLAAAAQLRTVNFLRDGLEHELRSPLNSIVLNLELLKELLSSGSQERVDLGLARVEVIGKAVTRLQARLGALWRELEIPAAPRATFDLAEVVSEVEALVGPQLRQLRLRLEVKSNAGEMPVEGRRESVRQAVLQLLVYTMRACPREGRIRLRVYREGRQLVLRIHGDGGASGVGSRNGGSALDFPYSNGRGEQGAGPYVARRLIEADGGELALDVKGSEGTTFVARLPEASP